MTSHDTTTIARRPRRFAAACAGLIAAGAVLTTIGCGGEEQAEAPAPAPRPVQKAEKPDPFEGLTMDPRVEFPRTREPASPEQAQAIADLASAIATGDEQRLRELLDRPAEAVLDTLIENGMWSGATNNIETVRVAAVEGAEAGTRVGLAIQDPRGAYLLAWSGAPANGQWEWTGLAVEAPEANQASELDGVALAEAPIPMPGATDDLTLEEIRRRRAEDRPEDTGRRGRRPSSPSPGRQPGFRPL